MEAFISYAREDREVVDALAAALHARGRSLWIDRQRVQPLTEWLAELMAAIANAEHFLIVLSPDWLQSRVCLSELEEAIRLHKELVPLHWRDVDPEGVHPRVRALQWVDFRKPAAFNDAVDSLLEALDRDLERVGYQTRLLRRALDWTEQERRRENLLAGADLAEAERFVGSGTDVPAEVRTYIEQSRAEATRAARIRRGVAAAVLLLFASVGSWVVTQGTRMRAEGTSRALAMKARDLTENDPERALLQAIEACRVAPTHEAKNVLWSQLAAAPNLLGIVHRQQRMTAMAIHPDGRRVALGDGNGMIAVVDTAARRVLGSLETGGEQVRSVAWAGDLLATSSGEESIVFWNPRTGTRERRWRVSGSWIDAIAVDRTATRLAVARDAVVEIYDIDGGAPPVVAMRFPVGGAKSLAFSSDGTLAAGTTYGTVHLYSRDEPVRETVVREGFGVGAVAFSADGTVLAAASDTGPIALLRASDLGAAVPTLFGHTGKVTAVDFDRTGTLLVSAGEDRTVRLWRWRDSEQAQAPLVFHREEVVGVGFGAGDTVVSGGESLVLLWRTSRHRELVGHTARVSGLAWTRNATLYSSSWDRTVRAWDAGTLTARRTLTSPHDTGRTVAVAPDGSFVASSAWNGDGRVVVWIGTRPMLLRRHPQTVWALAADEHHVYSATEAAAWVLAFSTRKRMLAAGTGEGVVHFPGMAVPAHAPSRVRNLGFSADGKLLMSHADNGQIAVWSTAARVPRILPAQAVRPTAAAALSPDGTIVAAAAPGALMLLDALTGERIGPIITPFEDITHLAFSPDGDRLAVASGERIQLIEAGVRAWVRRGCAVLARGSRPDPVYARVCGRTQL